MCNCSGWICALAIVYHGCWAAAEVGCIGCHSHSSLLFRPALDLGSEFAWGIRLSWKHSGDGRRVIGVGRAVSGSNVLLEHLLVPLGDSRGEVAGVEG